MFVARMKLVGALILFLAWLTWLGVTVLRHRSQPPEIVSRSQLLQATTLLVGDVSIGEDGLPMESVQIHHSIDTQSRSFTGTIRIRNIKSAQSSLAESIKPGKHLLLLTGGENEIYEIAGWPRSATIEARQPNEDLMQDKKVRRPIVYPWNMAVETQLKSLGYEW